MEIDLLVGAIPCGCPVDLVEIIIAISLAYLFFGYGS